MLYILEVEVLEILKHIGNIYIYIYASVYKSITLKFSQAQITCATSFRINIYFLIFGIIFQNLHVNEVLKYNLLFT